MTAVRIHLRLYFALLAIAMLVVHPTISSSSCSAADLNTAQSILRASINASEPAQRPSEAAIKHCPALVSIIDSLRSVISGILQIEQAGICSDRINKLRKAFNQKVTKILTTKRLESLRTQVDKLQTEMTDATTELYEDAVASVIKLLTVNQAFSVRSFSKPKLTLPLDELNPDYRLYLSPLQYLNRTNNEALVGGVFEAVMSRLNKLSWEIERRLDTGRNDLVTLLCWTVHNKLLNEKYREKRQKIVKLAVEFYPQDGATKQYRADIAKRKTCTERFPDTVIRGMALGLRDEQ